MELMHLMSKLKLEHLPANLDALCEQAAGQDLDYRSFLTERMGWPPPEGAGEPPQAGTPPLDQDAGAIRL